MVPKPTSGSDGRGWRLARRVVKFGANGDTGDTMTDTMPNTSKAMEPDELRQLMDANGVAGASQLAEKIGVHRNTVHRWLKGTRRIDRAAAALIFTVLKKPKK